MPRQGCSFVFAMIMATLLVSSAHVAAESTPAQTIWDIQIPISHGEGLKKKQPQEQQQPVTGSHVRSPSIWDIHVPVLHLGAQKRLGAPSDTVEENVEDKQESIKGETSSSSP